VRFIVYFLKTKICETNQTPALREELIRLQTRLTKDSFRNDVAVNRIDGGGEHPPATRVDHCKLVANPSYDALDDMAQKLHQYNAGCSDLEEAIEAYETAIEKGSDGSEAHAKYVEALRDLRRL